MDDEDKSTVFNILEAIEFYCMKHNKGLHSAKMKNLLYNLPKAIAKNWNPRLKTIGNLEIPYEEASEDLKSDGIEKVIIPSNINDNYTRLEILLGLKLSGHVSTVTEASNLFEEI